MKRRITSTAALVLVSLFMLVAPALAQAPSPAPAGEQKKTLWQTIAQGGWVMVPIGLCSIATLYLIGDGIIRTSSKRVAPPEAEQNLKAVFRNGDYVGAYNYAKENPLPLTNVLRVGIGLLGEGKEMTEEGMAGELGKENSSMQTYISYLSVIGVCTPMIGLLGTVTGMIKAFQQLGAAGIGDPSGLAAA